MVEKAKKPFCFVINGATPRSIIAKQAVSALAEHGKVAPATIHQRVDFAASMTDGRTVLELARNRHPLRKLRHYVNTF